MTAQRTLVLACAGALLTALYATASMRMPLIAYFHSSQTTVDFVHMLGPGWQWPTVLYLTFVGAAFALYAAALAVVWQGIRIPRLALFGFPVLFALALMPMYPPTAVDMFHYHALGRAFWVFGANPLTTPQGALPYPIGMSWADLPSPYGPLWSLLVAPASVLPGEHFEAGLLAFKAMAALSYLGCAALIWRTVCATRLGEESLAVVLFAWNPFVLLRTVGNGHNDLWMLLFVLLAFETARQRRWTPAVLFLTLSVVLKFASALLGPPLLLYIWTHSSGTRRERLALLGSALACAFAIALAVYAPFWAGLDTFKGLLLQSRLMITSTPVLLDVLFARVLDAVTAAEMARVLPTAVFLVLYVALVRQAGQSFAHLVVFSFTILFLYLLLATSWFRPWYMLWPVTLAALRPRSWLAPTLLSITIAASVPDLVEQFRGYWPWLAPYERAVAAPILLAFLPPLIVWLVGVFRHDGWGLDARPDIEEAVLG